MIRHNRVASFVVMASVLAAAGCSGPSGTAVPTQAAPFTPPSGSAPGTAALVGNKSDTDLSVHMVDVGQGNCILVECPGANPLMNDCGSTSLNTLSAKEVHDYVSKVIAPYVTFSTPDPLTLFVSHSDDDHLNLIYDSTYGLDPSVVGTIYVSEQGKDYSKAFQDWAAKTPAYKNKRYYHFAGTGPYYNEAPCGKAKVDVVAVNAKYGQGGNTANADSIILRVGYLNFRALFTGDAEGSSEKLAIANVGTGGVFSDLVLGSHHGADTKGSNGKGWVEATNPQLVAFSAGHNSGYGHPRCTVVQRYIDNASNLATMGSSLGIACGLGSSQWGTVSTKKGVLSTYMNGTITVVARDDDTHTLSCSYNTGHCLYATGVSSVAPSGSKEKSGR